VPTASTSVWGSVLRRRWSRDNPKHMLARA
jgi:hypothetical protein